MTGFFEVIGKSFEVILRFLKWSTDSIFEVIEVFEDILRLLLTRAMRARTCEGRCRNLKNLKIGKNLKISKTGTVAVR